ncbi:hypothetical protein DFH06DRAFT_1190197 [Mycena polygramma]|nr:hypothetical protein DFH06DRAFT_1190197 [Mycena polygramma]
MHPSLHLSSLNRLPITARRIATAACAPHPSPADIERLKSVAGNSPSQSELFLPVYYSILDPQRIPAAEQLESCDTEMLHTISAALQIVNLLPTNGLSPPAIGEDLWPRVWEWTNFLWTFRDFLSGMFAFSEGLLCLSFITFTSHICRNSPRNATMVVSTPGFQVLVVRAWAYLLQSKHFASNVPKTPLSYVHRFLTSGIVTLEDRVAGAGGTIHDLAGLVISHIDRVITNCDAPLTADQVSLLRLVLDIALFTDGIEDGLESDGSNFETAFPLCHALATRAFAKTLTLIVRTNSHTVVTDNLVIVEKCFGLLVVFFKFPTGNRLLRIALQHGLLLAIVACAKRTGPDNLHDTLSIILTQVVGPASVHYLVLADLARACSAAEETIGSEPFHRPDVFEAWTKSLQGVHEHGQVLLAFTSKEGVSRGACDNTECGIILEKASLRRCSGCRDVLYCSIPCQRRDWQSGHRESCVFHRKYRADVRLAYTPREYAFLRAILHHDYEVTRTVDLYRVYADEWAVHSETMLYTAFDYRLAGLKLSVQRARINTTDSNPVYWADMIARAARSAGRMELHFMSVSEGGMTRNLVIPLRRTTSDLPDALRQIAFDMGSLEPEQVQEQLLSLVNRDISGEIH